MGTRPNTWASAIVPMRRDRARMTHTTASRSALPARARAPVGLSASARASLRPAILLLAVAMLTEATAARETPGGPELAGRWRDDRGGLTVYPLLRR